MEAASPCEQEQEGFRLRTVLILGLGNAVDAVEVYSIGYILAIYKDGNGLLSRTQQSVLAAAVFVGMLLGGLVFGLMSDRIGRRKSLLHSLLLNAVFALLTAASPNVSTLILCRMLGGIGIGGTVPAIFTLCTELAPKDRRGFYVTIVAAHWMIGSVFTAGLAWIMLGNPSTQVSWRLFAATASAPAFLCWCLILLYVPESKQFHLQYRRVSEESSPRRVNRPNTSRQGTNRCNERALLLCASVDERVDAGNVAVMSMAESYQTLFHPELLATTASLMISWFCLSFGSYGLATWIPVLFERIQLSNPFANAFIYAAGNLPGNIYSAFLMDKWGGRRMLFVSMVLAAASAGGFAFFTVDSSNDTTPWGATVAIITLSSAFNAFSTAGWNAIDLMSAESFPTEVRTTCMGLLTAAGRGGSIIAQMVNGFLIGPPPHVPLLLSCTATMMLVGSVASLFAKSTGEPRLPTENEPVKLCSDESSVRVADPA